MRVSVVLSLIAVVQLVAACSGEPTPSEQTPRVVWTERLLPDHPGASGRNVVRDAVSCGGVWYVVGAVFLDEPTVTRDTRPAAWNSIDGTIWTPVAVLTETYWGRRAILNSVACSNDRIAVVGARSGGAHGNPRVTTFRLLPGGQLADVPALFTQYGGVSATNVGPISGGPAGWLIAGNRLSGPAVWVTDNPQGFTLVEGEPGLTQDGDLDSLAQAAGWTGEEWVLVGAGARTGEHLNRDPLAWTSPDGLAWQLQEMPADAAAEDVQRVAALTDGRLLALGLQGDGYAAWLRDVEGRWKPSVPFGHISKQLQGAPYVASVAVTAWGILATVSTGADYELWHSEDGTDWDRVTPPLSPEHAGDHTLMVAAGDAAVLLADSGNGARVWTSQK